MLQVADSFLKAYGEIARMVVAAVDAERRVDRAVFEREKDWSFSKDRPKISVYKSIIGR